MLAAKPDSTGSASSRRPDLVPAGRPGNRYPLLLCSPKSKRAPTRSTATSRSLARVDPDDVWMHPDDAAARGIADGQKVRVFNDRGATILPAQVTDRIAPGIVSIKEGAWFTPGADGVDTRGLRQRADPRPLRPVGRDDLQHQSGRHRPAGLILTPPFRFAAR